jgi:hypothetical protein
MSDPLTTYLHDHLAASLFAVELLKNLHEQHDGQPLGAFAAALLLEVEEDRQSLQRVVDQAGTTTSVLKEATAWVGEKVSRFKLRHASSGEIGTFEALETLALGILGKQALWRALSVVAPTNVGVRGEDFEALAARAQAQHAQVEERRLEVARIALRAAPE